jgi:hypothetical protein
METESHEGRFPLITGKTRLQDASSTPSTKLLAKLNTMPRIPPPVALGRLTHLSLGILIMTNVTELSLLLLGSGSLTVTVGSAPRFVMEAMQKFVSVVTLKRVGTGPVAGMFEIDQGIR